MDVVGTTTNTLTEGNMLREIKGTQRLPRLLGVRVDGTGTASILAGGNDVALTDNGTGDYTLTFAVPFARVPQVVASPLAADVALHVSAVSVSAVTVKARTVAGSPAAVDADFHVIILGSDAVDET
jgi:hypothetical protein